MKKLVCAILTLMLCLSIALAECACTVEPAMVVIANRIVEMNLDMTTDDLNALSSIALGHGHWKDCKTSRKAALNVLMDNTEMISLNLSNAQVEVIRAFIIGCGCSCGDHAETVKPVATVSTHQHRGGSHANSGRCAECGYVYQSHQAKWFDLNNDQHQERCSCGWIGAKQNHKVGESLGTENGMTKFRCSVCNGIHYWFMNQLDYDATVTWCDACDRPIMECCDMCQCYGCAG